MSKTVGIYLGSSKIPKSQKLNAKTEVRQRIGGKYPDFFPGSVKHSLFPESHLFFCALSCVQGALEMIPKAEPLFDNIVDLLNTRGCQKILNMIDKKGEKFAIAFGKFIALYLQKKWYARLFLAPRFLIVMPTFLFNRDIHKLAKLIRQFTIQVYNRDPDRPRVKGSPWLFIAIVTAARFCHAKIDPYGHDRQHRPLSAEVALIRPKTVEGRAAKSKYDKAMKKFKKYTDKYYRNGARKWLLARVICSTLAIAAGEQLNIDPAQLSKDLIPYDEAMGYQR